MAYYMEHNRTLEKLRSGKIAFGIQLRTRSPLIAELAGYLGFDYLYIETEHFACNDETIENLVRAAQLSDITPWVRTTNADSENIGHLLDLGVKGIILPHIETAEQANAFVEAVKFPPTGHRGNSPTSRAAQFGCMAPDKYMSLANKNCSAIAMIESVRAVENLPHILNAGIDLIRVGFGDLSLDMGIPGQIYNPEFIKVIRHITETAGKKGVFAGAKAKSAEDAAFYASVGFKFINLSCDIEYLKNSMSHLLHSAQEAVKK